MSESLKITPADRTLPSPNLSELLRSQFLGNDQRQYESGNLRVVLYSHDTMGIGHTRRNLLIAQQIKSRFPNAAILVITGARESSIFSQAAGIDCLTLPSFFKCSDGSYTSRNLPIPPSDILDFRRNCILTAIQSFQPNLLIVDKVPGGAGGELLDSLEWVSETLECHCALGLRDILDDPVSVQRDWEGMHAFEVVRRFFDEIWIYGDPLVYDAITEYGFPPDIARLSRYTGYLDTQIRLRGESSSDNEPPYVLCTVGGGQDGAELPRVFLEAVKKTGHRAKIIAGPFMPTLARQRLHQGALGNAEIEVLDFVDEGDRLVRQASHVVSMGGYNTLAAILSFAKPALIVPRVSPRQEQWIRANRLQQLGLIDAIHPEKLTVEGIASWLTRPDTAIQPARQSSPLNMSGLRSICEFIESRFCNAAPFAIGACHGV